MEDKKSKFKVLLVCTGNTCRSPMAEGILKKLLREKGISGIEVGSAGISALDGYPVTIFALEATRVWDIDLDEHFSRRLISDMLEQADLILVMSPEHLKHIQRMDKKFSEKSYLLKAFPQKSNNADLAIEDPIGGSLEDYNQCFLELEEELRRALPEIIRLYEKKNEKEG